MLFYDKEKKEWIKKKGEKGFLINGFYNAHSHVAMTLLKGKAENLPLHEWLKNIVWPIEEKLSKKDVYYSSLLGFYEMIRNGIVMFNDMYWKYPEEIARAAEEIGIKGYVCYDVGIDYNLKKARTFLKKKYKHVKPAIAVHSIYKADEKIIKEAYEIAKEYKTIFHMHLAETREELFYSLSNFNKRPATYLNDLKVIDENTVLAHVSWVTTEEIKMLAKTKALIVHCPTSNLKLATGAIFPLHEFQKYNANIALGTDSVASNNSLSILQEMKLASILQKHRYWDASLPDLKLLFDSTIAKTKSQVFISASLKDFNVFPYYDPYYSIIYSADVKNIKRVVIEDEVFIDDYNFVDKHRRKIKKAVEYIEKISQSFC